MTIEARIREIIRTHMPSKTRPSDDVTMTVRSLESLLGQAARIGAEIEREDCAQIVEDTPTWRKGDSARAIRARGGK